MIWTQQTFLETANPQIIIVRMELGARKDKVEITLTGKLFTLYFSHVQYQH